MSRRDGHGGTISVDRGPDIAQNGIREVGVSLPVLPIGQLSDPKAHREETGMSDTIQVEAARIPDRNKLLELLREHGLDAQPENEVSIIVPCDDDGGELFSYVEGLIMQIGAPFVPIKHEGVIYIRPPVG